MKNESILLLEEKIAELSKLERHNRDTLKRLNILNSVKLYLVDNRQYINEIAEILSISSSSVQRYLNDELIEEELGNEVKTEIKEKLIQMKKNGNIKGGINYSRNNIALKDKKGKFIGSKIK